MRANLFCLSAAVLAVSLVSGNAYPNQIATGAVFRASATIPPRVIPSDAWSTYLSVPISIPSTESARHDCIATAGADVQNPGGQREDQQYQFAITLDNVAPSGITETATLRTLELRDNSSIDDPNFVPVATTAPFSGLTSGAHTFRFVARKQNAANRNAQIHRMAISVICIHR
jgi:hypothetical protein